MSDGKNKRLIKIITFFNIFCLLCIFIAAKLRQKLILSNPSIAYIFSNEVRNRYIRQKYVFTCLKIKQTKFFKIKTRDNIFLLEGSIYFDNPTTYDTIAPVLQYKIIFQDPKTGTNIILDQNYYKMNEIIPAQSTNHKVSIKIFQKVNSRFWRRISKKRENISIIWNVIERYN